MSLSACRNGEALFAILDAVGTFAHRVRVSGSRSLLGKTTIGGGRPIYHNPEQEEETEIV